MPMADDEDSVPRSLITRVGDVQTLLRERLWLQVLVGMALGIGLGLLLSPSFGWLSTQTSSLVTSWLALPGQAFLASIKFVVVPLVLASVIRGIAAGENPEIVGGIGVRTLVFFILTTICAVLIGLLCAYLIVPGSLIDPNQIAAGTSPSSPAAAATAAGSGVSRGPPNLAEVPRQIVALVPTNLLTSLVQGEMLHIVIGSAILGIAMLGLPSAQSKPVLDVLGGLQAVCMVIVKWVLRFAPIAVFGLMADVSSRIGLKAIAGMGAYVGTVIVGLMLLLGLYLLIVTISARRSPIVFFGDIREVLLLAFSADRGRKIEGPFFGIALRDTARDHHQHGWNCPVSSGGDALPGAGLRHRYRPHGNHADCRDGRGRGDRLSRHTGGRDRDSRKYFGNRRCTQFRHRADRRC
jgi:Na+/H+-dicarboxylate symporter